MMRSPEDAQHFMPYMLAAHLLIGYGLTWLYMHFNGMPFNGARADRVADSSLGAGLRFGAAVAVMSTIPGYLIYYAVQPLPAMPRHTQMSFSSLAMLLLGLLLAWLNPGRRTLCWVRYACVPLAALPSCCCWSVVRRSAPSRGCSEMRC